MQLQFFHCVQTWQRTLNLFQSKSIQYELAHPISLRYIKHYPPVNDQVSLQVFEQKLC
jgi:hypothetical protein